MIGAALYYVRMRGRKVNLAPAVARLHATGAVMSLETLMVKIFIAFVALTFVACGYSASFVDCTVRCTSNECPSGYTCTGGLCSASGACGVGPDGDAAVGDTPATDVIANDSTGCLDDLDCDGVPDSSDNCRNIKNPGQENEDGDSFGDACDPCPPVADVLGAIVDQDSDGVPDACDPNPMVAGDHLVFFEGFHDGVPATWTAPGWTVGTAADGDVSIAQSATPATLLYPLAGSASETVSASIHVVARSMLMSMPTYVGVVDDYASEASQVACELFDDPVSQASLRLYDGSSFLDMPQYEFTAGNDYVLTQTRSHQQFTCHAVDPSAPNLMPVASGTSTINNPSPTMIGIRVLRAQVDVHWVMVVASP